MNKIDYFLKKRKIRRVRLAEKIGVSPGTISDWCHHRHEPSLENIFKVAQALDLKPTSLINNDYVISQ